MVQENHPEKDISRPYSGKPYPKNGYDYSPLCREKTFSRVKKVKAILKKL
jgi:hypothetical protein